MGQAHKEMAGSWKRLHAALNVGDSYGNYRCPETAEAGEPSKRRFFAVVRHRPGTKALTRLKRQICWRRFEKTGYGAIWRSRRGGMDFGVRPHV